MRQLIFKSLMAMCAISSPAIASSHALALPSEKNVTAKAAPTKVTHPEWSRDAVIYEVNWRQMTPEGTIAAVEKQIPRLKELGVDILCLLYTSPSPRDS